MNKILFTKEKSSKSNWLLNTIITIGLLLILFYYLFSAPIRSKDVIIHITTNESLSKISNTLLSEKIIRNQTIFKIAVVLFSGDKNISNGDYLFEKDANLIRVAWQVSRGIHGVDPIRVTLTEGMTNVDMANVLAGKISAFRKDLFLSDIRSKEGYLFPDTYFFFSGSTTDEILTALNENFKKRIFKVNNEIISSGKNLSDIITMASILEKEANGKEDSQIISGILWKRIKLGMPLQVDAAPITYKEINLPKNPISNPGLLAISSAINPESSPYLFYLHDRSGQIHYALNYSQHQSNIARYLK